MTHDDPNFLPYAAGLFDGEGSIGIYQSQNAARKGRVNITLRAQLANSNKAVIDLFLARWGGYFYKNKPLKPTHRVMYRWAASPSIAVKFIEDCGPYLVIKKPEADVALEYQRVVREGIRGNQNGLRGRGKLSPDELSLRLNFVQRLKDLKRAV